MTQLFANNCKTTLAAPCSNVATSITLSDASAFPSPTGNEFFLLTLYQLSGATETNYEILKCTSRSGNVLTVSRAFEDASRFTAKAYSAGDFAELRLTAGGVGGLLANTQWETITANTNAVIGRGYAVDTTSAAVTLTLPASAAVGDEFHIFDKAGTFATNNLTVARNGLTIGGLAQDMTVSANNADFSLKYTGTTWRPTL